MGRADFSDGIAALSAGEASACATAPGKPAKSRKKNGNTFKTRPTLKWNAANCADTYNVMLKDTTTGAKADKKNGLTELQYKTKTLTAGKTYKWFKACSANGCTKSATWKFTVQ